MRLNLVEINCSSLMFSKFHDIDGTPTKPWESSVILWLRLQHLEIMELARWLEHLVSWNKGCFEFPIVAYFARDYSYSCNLDLLYSTSASLWRKIKGGGGEQSHELIHLNKVHQKRANFLYQLFGWFSTPFLSFTWGFLDVFGGIQFDPKILSFQLCLSFFNDDMFDSLHLLS